MVWGLQRGATRRSRFEIIASILSLCSGGPTQKTQIMYRCNLSYEQLQKYLEYLTRAGFLEVVWEHDKDFYRATEAGREFMRGFQALESLVRLRK